MLLLIYGHGANLSINIVCTDLDMFILKLRFFTRLPLIIESFVDS